MTAHTWGAIWETDPRIVINVLQEDIDAANVAGPPYGVARGRGDPILCPINRAAQREFGIECCTLRASIRVGGVAPALLPYEEMYRLWLYDMGHGMSPHSFETNDPRARLLPLNVTRHAPAPGAAGAPLHES